MPDPLESEPDPDLVSRARSGHADAFRILVERHQDKLYSAVLRFCGDATDAEDILQRAFVNAWRKLPDFQGDSAFSTWMFRIAFNQAVSFRREGARHRRPSLDATDGEGRGIEPAVHSDPSDGPVADDERRRVLRALDALDPGDRGILVLKDLEDKPYAEIAEILGIPVGTVRSRLFRARQALKEILKSA